MVSIQVKGQRELERVVASLVDHADGKSIRLKMLRDMRREVRFIGAEQTKSLLQGLPKSGGAAATIGSQMKTGTSIKTGGKSVGVTLVDSWKGHDMKAIDAGDLRHPLWDNRRHWYTTRIKRQLLTRPFIRHAPQIRRAIIRSLDAVAREIARET